MAEFLPRCQSDRADQAFGRPKGPGEEPSKSDQKQCQKYAARGHSKSNPVVCDEFYLIRIGWIGSDYDHNSARTEVNPNPKRKRPGP